MHLYSPNWFKMAWCSAERHSFGRKTLFRQKEAISAEYRYRQKFTFLNYVLLAIGRRRKNLFRLISISTKFWQSELNLISILPDCDEDDEEERVVAVEGAEGEQRVRRHVLVPLVLRHPSLELDVTWNERKSTVIIGQWRQYRDPLLLQCVHERPFIG